MITIYKITSDSLSDFESASNVKIVSPIFGGDIKASNYYNYIINHFNSELKILSPGEVGCTLTHLSIMKKIIQSNKDAIILENDIFLTNENYRLLFENKENLVNYDFVHLGWHPSALEGIPLYGKLLRDGFYKVSPYHLYGTFSYYVSVRFAKAYLEFHEFSLNRADCWSEFFYIHSEISPVFFPVFQHPAKRGSLDQERSLKPRFNESFKSALRINIKKKLNRLFSQFANRAIKK